MRLIKNLIRSKRSLLAILSSIVASAGVLFDLPWVVAVGILSLGLSVSLTSALASSARKESLRATQAAEQASRSHAERQEGSVVDPIEAARHRILEIEEFRRSDPLKARPDMRGIATPPDGPIVSIVIPAYNEESYVAAAIESVRQQSVERLEILVVDDASTDRTLMNASKIARSDKRVRVLRHLQNAGLGASRNTGLRYATAPFVTFLDADDLLTRSSIADRLDSVVGQPEDVAGSFCSVELVPEDAVVDDFEEKPHKSPRIVSFTSDGDECPFNSHAPLLRAEVVRSVGGFDERLTAGGEDWDLWYRLMRCGYRFVPSSLTTALYRQKNRSMVKRMGDAHAAVGLDLIDAANTPDDRFAMHKPVYEYRQDFTKATRLLRTAGISWLAGDDDAFSTIMDRLSELDPWALSVRTEALEEAFDGAARRTLGMSSSAFRKVISETERLRSQFEQAVESRLVPVPTPEPTRPETSSFDLLFAPQTGESLRAMIATIDRADSIALLDPSVESGDMGVSVVAASSGLPSFSPNQWILGNGRAGAMVVAFPWAGSLAAIAESHWKAGGRVYELQRPEREILRVGDSPPQPPWVEGLSPGDALETSPSVRSASAWGPPSQPEEIPGFAYALEEYPTLEFDADRIASLRDQHAGERCIIIGNGPSLNDLDLSLMAGTTTIAVNGLFYAAERMRFDPTYYVVEDNMFMQENIDQILDYPAGTKLFPSNYRNLVPDPVPENVHFFMMNRGFYAPNSVNFCVPRFSTDIAQRIYCGQSVTIINLQLAYYLGFSEVMMIGMDFNYTVPDDAEVSGNLIVSQSDDPNHFHPDYFGKGKTWKDPKLDRVLSNYQLAKLQYEADGRRIVNGTRGGKLELFERVRYEDWLAQT